MRKGSKEAAKAEGEPPPPVFFVRVANKGLRLDAASTFDDTGLKAIVFSVGCTVTATGASSRFGREVGVTSCKTLRVRGGTPSPGFL
jgi:hypothetical protein